MGSIEFSNEGVLVKDVGDRVVKTVRNGDRQLTGKWTPQQLVDREIRALTALKDVAGIPRLLSRESPVSFSMSKIDGTNLTDSKTLVGREYFLRLRSLLKDIGDHGVYRFGQNRKDYLLQPDGSPGIIDFGNVCFADENPALVQAARIWNLVRTADLERRLGQKTDQPLPAILR